MIIKMVSKENGYALVLVLVVMLILFMLGTVLVGVSTSQVREAVKQQERVQAYYLAYSGANAVAEWITSDSSNTVPEGPSAPVTIGAGSFVVGVVASNSGNTLTITSQGTVDGYTETVVVTLTRQTGGSGGFPLPTDMAVFSNTTINMSNGTIVGPIGTNATNSSAILLTGDPSITGDVWVGPGASADIVDKPHWVDLSQPQDLDKPRNYEMPDFPEYPDTPTNISLYPDTIIELNQWNSHKLVENGFLNGNNYLLGDSYNLNTLLINGNYKFTEINLRYNLYLDLGGEDRIIVVDKLNISGSGRLYFKGGGNLTIYVKDELKLGDETMFNFDLEGGEHTIVVGHLNLINGHVNLAVEDSLTIYVKDQISLGSGSTINKTVPVSQSNTEKLKIYYKGVNPVTLDGSQEIHGSIYSVSESAVLTLTAGGAFLGSIVSGGNVILDGGSDAVVRVLYAPNSHVTLGGGAYLSGSIIANSFSMSGGSEVIYDASINDADIPFFDGTNGNDASDNWGSPIWAGE